MTNICISTVPTLVGKQHSEQLFSAWGPNNNILISYYSGSLSEQFGTVGVWSGELDGKYVETWELLLPAFVAHPITSLHKDAKRNTHWMGRSNLPKSVNPHHGGQRHG